MDPKPKRRSTISVQSTAPSTLRQSFEPSSSVPVPARRTAFLRHCSNNKSDPPIPAALARVKGTSTMNSPSRLDSETSWFNGHSPLSGTPRATRRKHGSRSGTPEPASTPLVNPSSTLLQDLLREQRATRVSRGPPPTDDCAEYMPRTPERSQSQSQTQTQSQSQEDAGSERQRKINSALSAGLKQPREMGFREMDQYISKINKQNFDLKLDIFHRAQQMAVLEKRLERMQQLEDDVQRMRELEEELQELRDVEEDNQRLRESNEQLRQEIDKRDQAVTEAVELICQLEARLEELEAGALSSRASTARPSSSNGPDAATPKNCVTPDIPERSSSRKGTLLGDNNRVSSESRSLTRAPSFLREEQPSTAALRSLYVTSEHPSRSARSAMTKAESMNSMTEITEPESPRLSALSECSELMPYDTINEAPLFNQVDTPVHQEKSVGTSETTPRPKGEIQASGHIRSSSWNQPQVELFPTSTIPKERHQAYTNASKEAADYIIKNGMFPSAPCQKPRLDDVFGGSKLPPTPDTMSTACASGTNRSNGSSAREKVQPYQQCSAPRNLGRPRSAGELTTKSSDHRDLERINPARSDVTLPRLSTEEREATPAIFPLNGIPSKPNYVFDPASPKPSMRYFSDVDDVIFSPGGIEKVISKMEKNYYSPPAPIIQKPIADMSSLSPPLTPQDWVEAAKPGPRPTKNRSSNTKTYTGLPPSKAAGARAPSQSTFLTRRHSVDSTLRDPGVPEITTLPLPPSDTNTQPVHQEREHRRRINLRPPFLGRLAQPRRLEPSPITDSEDSGDGAPSPVIRKARIVEPPKTAKTVETMDASQRVHGELCGSAPTYAAANTANSPSRTLPHSFTESNFWSHSSTATTRPSTSASKGHKRRSSLGIFGFGWMKGSSGSGSHHKKAGADSTATAQTTNKERPIPRWGPDSSNTLPEAAKSVGAYGAIQDMSASVRYMAQKQDDDDSTRRPRYIERRTRRPLKDTAQQ
ncbi:hypothetical protein IFM58399_00186 [Aspergillus lentulus]|uniref:Centrosomin N-terminal motif 1 domain-containing protein n=1 Tax=Aspergillus lentulus TaxID=293939 RepID=A0ABQ0ZQU8_ASPLE|nr:uncharacterized protein IFM58399_00186 [Aspergillus lentulus]KAF4153752.1 hypothetical protein CNMCM6069_000314 [Aspergillus lentulus]KAF4175143.1 hypothetical protein CNMCM8060_007741 [Aspergillus lentulus]KAF4176683.1 hypothetical protein CNMCM7927_003910 [Aspergillus lentulus]KAF4195295.1 hypothetical protein CNMCM8694_006481 [Aspergillus lentulus]GFF23144.1 hypothetical protein IFM58399_00186 [Aspergillus lentulus]